MVDGNRVKANFNRIARFRGIHYHSFTNVIPTAAEETALQCNCLCCALFVRVWALLFIEKVTETADKTITDQVDTDDDDQFECQNEDPTHPIGNQKAGQGIEPKIERFNAQKA